MGVRIRGGVGIRRIRGMKHVRADFLRAIAVEVLQHHFFAIDHLPVAGQYQVIADPVDEWHQSTALAQRGHAPALEAVPTIDHDCVVRVFHPQRVDHRLEYAKSTALPVDSLSVLVEELVVRMQLRVDVGGMQDSELAGPTALYSPTLHQFIAAAARRQGHRGTYCKASTQCTE